MSARNKRRASKRSKRARKTREAFRWIVSLLRENRIPFQVNGGLAARYYGSRRKLADIDIEIRDNGFRKIPKSIKDFVVFGPARYRDKKWDLKLLMLRYGNQDIDVSAGDSCKIFDGKRKRWIFLPKTDLSKSPKGELFGIRVPIASKEELLKTKTRLNRKVDRIDIRAIKNLEEPPSN